MFNQCFWVTEAPWREGFGRSGQEQAMCSFSTLPAYPLPARHSVWRRDSGKNGNNVGSWRNKVPGGVEGDLLSPGCPYFVFELSFYITCLLLKDKVKHSCSHLLTTVFGVSVGLWSQTPVQFLTLTSCANLSKFLSTSKPLFPYCNINIMCSMLEIKLEIESPSLGSGNWSWTEAMPRDTDQTSQLCDRDGAGNKQDHSITMCKYRKEQRGPNRKSDKMSLNRLFYVIAACLTIISIWLQFVLSIWTKIIKLVFDRITPPSERFKSGLSLPSWDPLLNLLTGAQILLRYFLPPSSGDAYCSVGCDLPVAMRLWTQMCFWQFWLL